MRPHYKVAWLALRAITKALFGYRIYGSENVPAQGPIIVAPNHVSYADPVLVGLGIPRELHFMAKEELFRPFLFGRLIRSYNAIPLRRGAVDRRALKEAVGVLEKGGALLVFPEGTRSKTGELLRARPGVGFLSATSGAPIIPCHLACSNRLRRVLLRREKLELRIGSPISPRSFSEKGREVYRVLGEASMEAIRALRDMGDSRGCK